MRATACGALIVLAGAALSAAACDADAPDIDHCAADISVCGRSIAELTVPFTAAPSLPVYADLLAEFSREENCRSAVKGSCDDGKIFVHSNGGFGSDTFYFDADTFVGQAWTSDVGSCGRCPFAGFYGTIANLRCDNPQWEALCGDAPWYGEPTLPFANGESPQACEPCN